MALPTVHELDFKPHPLCDQTSMAMVDYANGYQLRIIQGRLANGDRLRPYEMAVMHQGEIFYAPTGGDVLKFRNAAEVDQWIYFVAELNSHGG